MSALRQSTSRPVHRETLKEQNEASVCQQRSDARLYLETAAACLRLGESEKALDLAQTGVYLLEDVAAYGDVGYEAGHATNNIKSLEDRLITEVMTAVRPLRRERISDAGR